VPTVEGVASDGHPQNLGEPTFDVEAHTLEHSRAACQRAEAAIVAARKTKERAQHAQAVARTVRDEVRAARAQCTDAPNQG
jgi:hypothetical protein